MQKESKHIESKSFQQIFQAAEQKLEQLDYDEAQYYYSVAYKKNPFHQLVVLCYANVLKQNDKRNQAKIILQKSIKQYPNGTYKRHFELGEIYSGVEAIKIFEAGIAEATKHVKNPFKSVTPVAEIQRDIAQAYASIAQICMTDLLQQPQAQKKCTEALQKGAASDATCLDVHLQMANYQLFKENFQLANKELALIHQAIMKKGEQYDSELTLQAAKYLIEVDQFSKSHDLLQTIHQDQANQTEVVYLLAYCSFKTGDYGDCQDYIQEYQQGQNNIKDEEIDSAMNQLIEQLKKIKKGNKKSKSIPYPNGLQQTQQGNLEQQKDQDDWMDIEGDENDDENDENDEDLQDI